MFEKTDTSSEPIHRLRKLIVSDTGIRFAGDDFRNLCKPSVYMFMRSGRPLYVGMSDSGIARPAQKGHRRGAQATKICDEMMIWACVGVPEARELESILIDYFKPMLNQRGKTSGKAKAIRFERRSGDEVQRIDLLTQVNDLIERFGDGR